MSGGSTGAGGRGRGQKRVRGGAARTANAGRAPRSHVATEQRRRDRINDGYTRSTQLVELVRRCRLFRSGVLAWQWGCGFAASAVRMDVHVGSRLKLCVLKTCCRFDQLRDLIPHKDKLDKAAFLQKTIDYICQLQVAAGQCHAACLCPALLTPSSAQGLAGEVCGCFAAGRAAAAAGHGRGVDADGGPAVEHPHAAAPPGVRLAATCAWRPARHAHAMHRRCVHMATCTLRAATLRMLQLKAAGVKEGWLMLPGAGRAADWHAPRWAAAVLHLWAAHVQHRRARQRHERRPPSITASGMLFVRPALQSPGPRCTTILHES